MSSAVDFSWRDLSVRPLPDRAIKFVGEKRSQLFFLYWSMIVPHDNNERTLISSSAIALP